jgi:hypothetical protein
MQQTTTSYFCSYHDCFINAVATCELQKSGMCLTHVKAFNITEAVRKFGCSLSLQVSFIIFIYMRLLLSSVGGCSSGLFWWAATDSKSQQTIFQLRNLKLYNKKYQTSSMFFQEWNTFKTFGNCWFKKSTLNFYLWPKCDNKIRACNGAQFTNTQYCSLSFFLFHCTT